jgi:hypothetical protein
MGQANKPVVNTTELHVHCPSICLQERKQVWGTKQFQQYIGMDVTSLLSVPVFIMEPFTILQKASAVKTGGAARWEQDNVWDNVPFLMGVREVTHHGLQRAVGGNASTP